jgi:hypothetical protein
MKYVLGLTIAGALILAAQIDRPAAQTNSEPVAQLSEHLKATVIKAAIEAKTHQKTPKEFTPAVGAPVPSSVFQHAFNPEITRAVPELKHYWYAYLDREIVLMDGLQKKVVALIPLPAKLVLGGQGNHGAAEPAGESEPAGKSKGEDRASTTGSVPAYTSPETIR